MNKTEAETAVKMRPSPSKEELERILRNHVYGAMGVGLFPVPFADFVALTGIQLNLVKKLAGMYDVSFSKDTVKNVLLALIGGSLPTAVGAPLAFSLAKAIPALGQTFGVVTMPVVGGAATYAIGKVFVRHFASGGTFLSFNPEKVKEYYAEMFKEGENIASDMKPGNDKSA